MFECLPFGQPQDTRNVLAEEACADHAQMRDCGPHPEPDVITSYCRGQVSNDLVADIEAHLKQCPAFGAPSLCRFERNLRKNIRPSEAGGSPQHSPPGLVTERKGLGTSAVRRAWMPAVTCLSGQFT